MRRPVAQTICFDLDGTLCTNTFGDYAAAQPFAWAIERLNALADAGHRIIVFTARGTATGLDWDELTRGQVERWGARYDELQFGKPDAAVFDDDRAVRTDAWRAGDAFALPGIVELHDGEESTELLPLPIPSAVLSLIRSGEARLGQAELARNVIDLIEAPETSMRDDGIQIAVSDIRAPADGG